MVSTIRAAVLYRVVRALDERFAPTEALLREEGLSRSILGDTYNLVSLKQYVRFFERAAAAMNDRWFGLRLGNGVTSADLGALGALSANASTLAQALDDMCRFMPALQTATTLRLDRKGDRMFLSYAVTDPGIGPYVQDIEYTLSSTCHLIRSFFGQHWSPLAIQLQHPAPNSANLPSEIFRAPVSYGERTNSIVFRTSDLKLTRHTVIAELHTVLERHVAALVPALDGSPRTTADRVGAAVAVLLPHGSPTLVQVAAELGLSPRSLQRALAGEGTSLRSIAQEQRMKLARELLADKSKSYGDVALALGYADRTVFARAYKKWVGRPPSFSRKSAVS